jgi:hypothetical protein
MVLRKLHFKSVVAFALIMVDIVLDLFYFSFGLILKGNGG